MSFYWLKSLSFLLNIVEEAFAYNGQYVCQYNSLTLLQLSIVYRIDFELHHVDEYTAYISLLNVLNQLDMGQTTDSLLNQDEVVQI